MAVTSVSSWIVAPSRSTAAASPRTSLAGWIRATPPIPIAPSAPGMAIRARVSSAPKGEDPRGLAPGSPVRRLVLQPLQLPRRWWRPSARRSAGCRRRCLRCPPPGSPRQPCPSSPAPSPAPPPGWCRRHSVRGSRRTLPTASRHSAPRHQSPRNASPAASRAARDRGFSGNTPSTARYSRRRRSPRRPRHRPAAPAFGSAAGRCRRTRSPVCPRSSCQPQ